MSLRSPRFLSPGALLLIFSVFCLDSVQRSREWRWNIWKDSQGSQAIRLLSLVYFVLYQLKNVSLLLYFLSVLHYCTVLLDEDKTVRLSLLLLWFLSWICHGKQEMVRVLFQSLHDFVEFFTESAGRQTFFVDRCILHLIFVHVSMMRIHRQTALFVISWLCCDLCCYFYFWLKSKNTKSVMLLPLPSVISIVISVFWFRDVASVVIRIHVSKTRL